MSQSPEEVIAYKRARFATRLPVARRYTISHFWLREEEPGVWQVGFSKFATRMLGELVEYEFSVTAGAQVEIGQSIGWAEGFKAVSDLYSVVAGEFLGGNPAFCACRRNQRRPRLERRRLSPDGSLQRSAFASSERVRRGPESSGRN